MGKSVEDLARFMKITTNPEIYNKVQTKDYYYKPSPFDYQIYKNVNKKTLRFGYF